MIKGLIQEEDITIVNIYAPNIGALKYIKQNLTELKGEINSNTLIVGAFSTSLSAMDKSFRQRISKEIVNLIYFVSKFICMFIESFISNFYL